MYGLYVLFYFQLTSLSLMLSFAYSSFLGFPGGSDGKESACSAGDLGSILGSGRSPGEGNGNPPQYSCLVNSKGRGAWRATVTNSQTRLSD